MDKIINYLLLTIIFVFDPLAIALVIAANFAFEKLRPKTRDNIYGEKIVVNNTEEDGMWTEEEMQDFNEQFNADDMLPDEEEFCFEPEEDAIEQPKSPQDQISKLEKQREEISRSTKDSRWKSRNLKEINEKINSLKQKESGDDLTITY